MYAGGGFGGGLSGRGTYNGGSIGYQGGGSGKAGGGSGSSSSSASAPAPSNGPHYFTVDICGASALLNRGAPAALDALGIIPGEGNLLAAGQLVASSVSVGISPKSSPNSVTRGTLLDATSAPLNFTGLVVGVLKSAGSAQFAKEIAPIAKVIPALGNFVSAAIFLRKATKKIANRTLEYQGVRHDLSELVEELLQSWISERA